MSSSLELNITNIDTDVTSGLDLSPDTTLDVLKALIEEDLHIPQERQFIFWEQKVVSTNSGSTTLEQLGITTSGMLLVSASPILASDYLPSSAANSQTGSLPLPQMSVDRRSAATTALGSNSNNMFDFSDIGVDARGNRLVLGQSGSATGGSGVGLEGSSSSSSSSFESQLTSRTRSLLEICKVDPATLADLRARNPLLGEALASKDESKVTEVLREQMKQHEKDTAERNRRFAAVAADPLSIESQRIVEEDVHRQNVDEQLTFAQEHMPETFARVVMLYVNIKVNGIAIKAFVDSGAQTTIMSKRFAEKCNLLRLVDKRFHGVAHGVGSSNIVGRIHTAQIQIGTDFFAASITVLEDDKMDFLFGLDMLRRHQMCIDLKKNVLKVGENLEVPFLSEAELSDVLDRQPSAAMSPVRGEVLSASSRGGYSPSGSSSNNSNNSSNSSNSRNNLSDSRAVPADKIAALMDLGFEHAECERALRETGENSEAAASLLFRRRGVI